MNRRKIVFVSLMAIFILLPLWMWLVWLMRMGSRYDILIIDKTVIDNRCQEHASLVWILRQYKYLKQNRQTYSLTQDYCGFRPGKDKKYEIRDLSGLNENDLRKISDKHQVLYVSDTYGVYSHEWFGEKNKGEHSRKIYGGLHQNDLLLMQRMALDKKLVMCEYNTFATPTSKDVRNRFERFFGLRWTGWAGRYFFSLDTAVNPELPSWVVKLYTAQYKSKWSFTNSGIVFVSETDSIVILENKTHLIYEVPKIFTYVYAQKKYKVPEMMNYPYWFDVCSTTPMNRVAAKYRIFTNKKGDSLLERHGLPKSFPAVIESNRYYFYYFCGDFCDNPVNISLSQYAGVFYLRSFMFNANDISDRSPFFWEYYRPLVTSVLKNFRKGY